nr:hypothetical protein [uncultured Blautia sp.]
MEDIPCCQRTLYSYVDKRYLSVINLDLPRKVRYKKRKKKHLDTPVPGYRKTVLTATCSIFLLLPPILQ